MSTAWPSVDSAWVTVLRAFSRARCSLCTREMRVMARSAWAAATGSSLARTTRLPEVRFSCRFESAVWRCDRLRSAFSYWLALAVR